MLVGRGATRAVKGLEAGLVGRGTPELIAQLDSDVP